MGIYELNYFGYIGRQMETIESYLADLSEDRKSAMQELLTLAQSSLPAGFELQIQYKMPTFVVPLTSYPAGYHCAANTPLPFISFASQKNFIAIYHMGIYADEQLLNWFQTEYAKQVSTKLDMGKSCIRFKKPDQIPFQLLGELFKKMTPENWIERYEKNYKPKK